MAAMDGSSKEAQAQIEQMMKFIRSEAEDKKKEIEDKAMQEASVEQLRLVTSAKEKIQQEYARKAKQVETQAAIARSTAINRSRLEKIKARQDMLTKLAEDSKASLAAKLKDPATMKKFVTQLMVQGLLMLLEDKVEVRCRASDDALVSSCMADAAKEYTRIIQTETGAKKECTLSLDKAVKLPAAPAAQGHGPSCLGGVVLACQNGSITIDNTIDSRLGLVMEQAKPTIRELLFTK
eukprot:TRINITY_DN417_c0_g1_i1.p1 TRINITY_DN417_c0_g1~~TRINITY_DN417_c0_g1_i1.p1  ORF type:complete len:262 (+),score=83.86 TRINITY_DN417_c0_g1_i1:76-786(+)